MGKYKVNAVDKEWLYRTLKQISKTVTVGPKDGTKHLVRPARKQFMKLVLKCTPGNDVMYLNDIERHILLSWLYRIKEASLVRADKWVLKRVTDTIDGLSRPYAPQTKSSR